MAEVLRLGFLKYQVLLWAKDDMYWTSCCTVIQCKQLWIKNCVLGVRIPTTLRSATSIKEKWIRRKPDINVHKAKL